MTYPSLLRPLRPCRCAGIWKLLAACYAMGC